MKKNTLFLSAFLFLTVFFALPVSAAINGVTLGLFPCDGPNCTFDSVLKLAQAIVNGTTLILLLISPLLIARAGYFYIMSAQNPGERKKANQMLLNIVIGLIIVLSGWTIITLILKIFLNPEASAGVSNVFGFIHTYVQPLV
jgi:hypothetical protein